MPVKIQISPHLPGRSDWSSFVASHPEGNVFQTPEMADLFRRSPLHEPVVLSALDEEENLVGLLSAVIHREGTGLKGKLSARSVVMGGPLVAGSGQGVAAALLREYDRFIRNKAIYSQFRNLHDMRAMAMVFNNMGYTLEPHINFISDLTLPEEYLWSLVQSRRRSGIRKALKDGMVVREITRKDQPLPETGVHAVLHEVYSRIRLPLPGKGFFDDAREILGKCGYYREFGAFLGDQLAGVMLVLCYRGTIYNWYAGSRRAFYARNPNDVIPWEIMRWGKQHGFSRFDIGGAGHPDKPYGVRDYKQKFGGERITPGRFVKVHQRVMMTMARAGFRVWQMAKW